MKFLEYSPKSSTDGIQLSSPRIEIFERPQTVIMAVDDDDNDTPGRARRNWCCRRGSRIIIFDCNPGKAKGGKKWHDPLLITDMVDILEILELTYILCKL
jgi:hypothetical protein